MENISEQGPSQEAGSVKVNLGLLDTLMNLAGELVLSRNQLVQGISDANLQAAGISSQRIDTITSELQEAIMKTRMQPISNIFNTFPRLIRDLSQSQEKSMEMEAEGLEVELDKSIMASIHQPMIQMVENAAVHGIELPGERSGTGKSEKGVIRLSAFQDAGHVSIEIQDDGEGLNTGKIVKTALSKGLVTGQQLELMSEKQKRELIFSPGFSGSEKNLSTAAKSIEDIGGVIETDSIPGQGTRFNIKLPLTLAIIPSQITTVGKEKYAIPQVNLSELLRIPAAKVKEQIEKVGDAAVVRLRGELLPLLDLSGLLNIEKVYTDPETGASLVSRRHEVADRRSRQHLTLADALAGDDREPKDFSQREENDRRQSSASAVNIAVVSTGVFKYGLVVDQFHDAEEIVVKPVGRHISSSQAFAGATIMGDGRVALILDIANIAQMASLSESVEKSRTIDPVLKGEEGEETISLLTFKNAETEYFAAPLKLVERIERFPSEAIEEIGSKKVVQYRGGGLPLFEISQAVEVGPLPQREFQEVIVFKVGIQEIGLMVTPPVDTAEVTLDLDENALKQPGIEGSMIINGHTTLVVDIFEMARLLGEESA